MDDSTFNLLFECIKILNQNTLTIPSFGKQKVYDAKKIDNEKEQFKVVINRKGHLNTKNLTYQLSSRHGILIRIDMDGALHENPNGQAIETPHVHIFSSEYDFGRRAIPLSKLTDEELIDDIIASFLYFLSYNNIEEPDEINSELI